MNGEIKITDKTTGGAKGDKLERFDLIPVEPLEELARLYGVNARSGKYSEDNWRKGYKFHLSYAALQRHATAWWRGEDVDAQTGRHHLACVMWHCATLIWLSKYRKSMDDRWHK